MTECSLENCNEECFENEDKCILHCDKEKTYTHIAVTKKFEEQLKIKYSNSINKFENIIFPKIDSELFYSFDGISFEECTFYEDVKINKNWDENKVLFTKCMFYDGIHLSELEVNESVFNQCKFKNQATFSSEKCTYNSNFVQIKNADENSLGWDYPYNIKFVKCAFNKNLEFVACKRVNIISITECKFESNIVIRNCKIVGALYITNNTFNDNFYITENFINNLVFTQCDVSKIGVITRNIIWKNNVSSISFKDTVTFKDSIFKSKLDLLNVRFFSNAIFQDMVIEDSIDLQSTIFYDETNFLDITAAKREKDESEQFIGSTININVSNRETARKIKDSFEKQNNIIEANKYYALEMKKREEELKEDKKDNWFEWLVFKIHGISSNHSQDALLALFWILVIGLLASSLSYFTTKDQFCDYCHLEFIPIFGLILISLGVGTIYWLLEYSLENKKHLYLLLLGFYLIYGSFTTDFSLTDFANVINPFSIMTRGETLNLSMLIFKVIIAYLIYQFVVSVRQNTRRK